MSEVVHAENQQLTANIKETIESILVAFILAFIFRAFVVEAFVIPTGSMATTLLGAHMRYQCPDCGYVFSVDYRPPGANEGRDDTVVPSEAMPSDDVYCPNCGYLVASGPMRDPASGSPFGVYDAKGKRLYDKYPGDAKPQPVRYGDRILVLKYAYLLAEPRRWDVVVFKAPADPSTFKYTQNFIKRLVGKPGETLMVLDGSIYVRDSSGQWQIQQRPPDVQEALWRVIYDNDYYPRGLKRNDRATPWVQPWQTQNGTGWNLGASGADGRVFRFSGQGEATIAYNAAAVPAGQTTNDYLAYDVPYNRRSPGGATETNPLGEAPTEDRQHNSPVSDFKLAFWYQRQPGQDGALGMLLSKRDHAFTAQITPDAVKLSHTHPDGTTTVDAGPVNLAGIGLAGAAPLWVEFMNVDYKVTLRLNGKVVLTTTAQDYSPDVAALKDEFKNDLPAPGGDPRIQITAGNQTCALSHVSLWRNVYYTSSNRDIGLFWAMPNNPVHLHRQGEPRERGTGVYDDDEYFVMGDNSRFSADARFWREPINLEREGLNVESGRVPGRFLLGKAFFVYWPAGFRPIAGWPALVPDFGDMRFIH